MLQELEIKALKGESKTSRLKIKPDFEREPLKKPDWIRIRLSSSQKVNQLKKILGNKIFLLFVKKHNALTSTNVLIMVRQRL